jgi:hypothetical protein
MKKTYIILTLLLTTLLLSSCETYDEYDAERETLVGFTLGATLELPLSAANPVINFNLPFFATEASTSDRIFRVVVVASETEVASENFSFEADAVLLANERRGTLVFTAMNVSLTNDFAPIVLAFEASDNVLPGSLVRIALKTTD